MNDNYDTQFHAQAFAAQMLATQGENLLIVADNLRKDMERQSLQVRDLILEQPPLQLLGYLWFQFYKISAAHFDKEEDRKLNSETIEKFQFALEYVHAVWSCHAKLADRNTVLNRSKVDALLEALESLKISTTMYCIASAKTKIKSDGKYQMADTEFRVKTAWAFIRGQRYQVLEEEFLAFVLEPHTDALRTVYGLESHVIAAGIQAIAITIRDGINNAIQKIRKGMERTHNLMEESNIGPRAAIEKQKECDDNFATESSDVGQDMLFDGICNLSRHTNLSSLLLEDLSYLPGENNEFFADEDFKGTPMRTLPAKIKPGIKLGDDYYVTDGQFIRDSAYRAIQRGLLCRLPSYREEWNCRQKVLIEQSFPTIFCRQFAKATTFSEVYFKHPKTGQWVETDLVMMVDDVLLVVEAKAGVMAMHSPATNFDRHERSIRNLIMKAYEQCKRFTEYLSSAPDVPLYNRKDGEYVEIGRLQQCKFRVILPIGLTVEPYTPISAMSKDLAEIQPLLKKHPFISMSVDNLFVLNRFLPTTGELLHYLEVRQQVAGIPNAILIDEFDHLGAYIKFNRFDMKIKNQFAEADLTVWNSLDEVVAKHFERETWKSANTPRQEYPQELKVVFRALDEYRSAGWLEMDSQIRNLNNDSRNNLAKFLTELKATLRNHSIRRVLVGNENNVIQIYLCRYGSEPKPVEMRFHGEVGCLAVNAAKIMVLQLSYNEKGNIANVVCTSFVSPPATQANYADLKREAERQRVRHGKHNL